MLLESNFKSYGGIRRKAYNVDNPVQAKRSSGFMETTPHIQPRSGLNYYVVPIRARLLFTSSCASLARGYQYVRPTVLLLKPFQKNLLRQVYQLVIY